jgi:hypothetical protein
VAAFTMPGACRSLASEAACFVQDLDQAWPPEQPDSEALTPGAPESGRAGSSASGARRPEPGRAGSGGPGSGASGSGRLRAETLLSLLDERLTGGRPTFLTAVPDQLPPGLEAAIRARLTVLEPEHPLVIPTPFAALRVNSQACTAPPCHPDPIRCAQGKLASLCTPLSSRP